MGFLSCDALERDSQRMQYHGKIQTMDDGSVFWGTGLQGEFNHHLVQVSGAAADRFSAFLLSSSLSKYSVSRVDIQLTLPLPEWFKARDFLDNLRNGVWLGRSRKCTMVDNYGADTVYIGSRKSDRFARLYVKEESYYRLEFEYKGDRAAAVFDTLKKHGLTNGGSGILFREVSLLPSHPVITDFGLALRLFDKLKPEVVKPESKRFKWFVKQCLPAIDTLLNDHDVGAKTAFILQDILDKYYDK